MRSVPRLALVACGALLAAFAPVACGLSASGSATATGEAGAGDPGGDGGSAIDVAPTDGGDAGTGADAARADAGSATDASPDSAARRLGKRRGDRRTARREMRRADAGSDGPPPCTPVDAGGSPALSTFVLKGNAAWNESGDGRITLTNSNNNEEGAAWSPSALPALGGYMTSRGRSASGPTTPSGDGLAFAVIDSSAPLDVGTNGQGVGLQGLAGPDGGVATGYAVVFDTYQNTNDPTDLGPATLKLVALPQFRVVAATAVPATLNDGNVYDVDVSWRAPGTLSAALHAPGGIVRVSAADPALGVAGVATLGFTGATGGSADSHNEIAGLTIADACQ